MIAGRPSTDVDLDVVIAGAGPAGVGTAVALMRAGVRPSRLLCLDRARFPRDKPCGGGLTGHALGALGALGLTVRVPAVACHSGRIAYGKLRAQVPLDRAVQIVRRVAFDADLVAQARERGVVVEEGEGVRSLEVARGPGVVCITTTAGRVLRARVLIGADGVGSVVRRRLLGEGARGEGQPLRLLRGEIPDPGGVARDEMLYDFSEMANGLRGYVWVFPSPGGLLNVGAMHHPGERTAGQSGDDAGMGGRTLEATLARALERFGLRAGEGARGWPAWPYDPNAPVAGSHVLLVGDAAGIDALTGEGIAVGLEHAPIAARFVADALGGAGFGFHGYGDAIRSAVVGRELGLDGRVARHLYAGRRREWWLGLVLGDAAVQRLYAARVCGARVLADARLPLVGILARQAVLGKRRERMVRRETRALAVR